MLRIVLLVIAALVFSEVKAEEKNEDIGLHIGGYASFAASRSSEGHGAFYVPKVSLDLNYTLNKGWKLGTVLVFDQGNTESFKMIDVKDKDGLDSGEGSLDFEEAWIQKDFNEHLSVRAGKLVLPVGAVNIADNHTQFSLFDAEEEQSVMPAAWKVFGVSLEGGLNDWEYQLMLTQSLNPALFNGSTWIRDGITNSLGKSDNYGGAVRIDYNGISNMRLGVSGYIDKNVSLGSFDMEFDDYNWIVRGNIDYGHLSHSSRFSEESDTGIGKNSLAYAFEAGYDIFSRFQKLKGNQKMYIYAHYGYYNTMESVSKGIEADPTYKKNIFSCGLNYRPISAVTVRAEYLNRHYGNGYNQHVTTLGLSYSF